MLALVDGKLREVDGHIGASMDGRRHLFVRGRYGWNEKESRVPLCGGPYRLDMSEPVERVTAHLERGAKMLSVCGSCLVLFRERKRL